MKELSLQEIQKISLDILSDVHSFCVANDINYSLAYGTLIGAVRHKGFIPWDDDIDIMMPRPDFEKFCSSYNSANNRLICQSNQKDAFIAYARVCDNCVSVVEKTSWISSEQVGVWIDVFPIDGTEPDLERHKRRHQTLRKQWKDLFYYRVLSRPKSDDNGKKANCLISIISCLHLSWLVRLLGEKATKRYCEMCSSIDFDKSQYCSQFSCPDNGPLEFYPTSLFMNYTMAEFESQQFMVISGWDTVLRTIYGDYMKLPPVSERIPKQSYLNFYWREK